MAFLRLRPKQHIVSSPPSCHADQVTQEINRAKEFTMYTASTSDNVSDLKGTAKNFRDAADDTKQDLKTAANRAGRKVRGFIHDAGDEIVHARDTVTTQIRTNPVQSSVIALGVGVVLGALLRR
jgi:ElaB/YqjD/DUF883 family membrane-anchored ribosome-binding protein